MLLLEVGERMKMIMEVLQNNLKQIINDIMKTKLLYLLGLVIFMISCISDYGELDNTTLSGIEIKLEGLINQQYNSRVDDGGFCDGDGIGVYVVNYQQENPGTLLDKGNQADNVRYVYNENDNKWTPDYPVYYYDKDTPVDIIGYYPYSNIDNVNMYSFEVQKDQSKGGLNGMIGGYEASDFLWGKAEKIVPSSSSVSIEFRHQMAGVQIELTKGEGFKDGEWNDLEKQVLISNTIRKSMINLASGQVYPIGDVPDTGIVPAKNGEMFRAVVVPQSINASVALFNITIDGIPYVFRKENEFEYHSGNLHKFTIEVSKKGLNGLEFKLMGESITAWESETITHEGTSREYVIINVPKASTDETSALKAAINEANKNYTKIKNLKVTGEVNSNDFYFMRDEMTSLQSVNMKEVRIVSNYVGQYENEIPGSAFSGKTTLIRFVFPENITKIGDCAFMGTNLTGSLILPNSITRIGSNAFSGGMYEGLMSLNGTLTLPENLQIIGESAFAECSNLRGELKIPDSVKEIGYMAFYHCSGFTGNLVLPQSLQKLNLGIFSGCSGFTGSLVIPNSVKEAAPESGGSWDMGAFEGCSGLNGTLTLSKNLSIIEISMFSGCNFRGPLELPENVTIIGESAFAGNKFSGSLVLPKNLAVLGDNAFGGCARFTGVLEIPNGLSAIPQTSFASCQSLEGIIIPKSVDYVNANAFANCFQLNSIVCHSMLPPELHPSAFNGVAKDNFTVEVPETSVENYRFATNWNEFKRIEAHRDFSINRNLFRTLNPADSKKLIIRASSGESWKVEDKPEWVTVEPMSGVGKAEVTITVDEMKSSEVGSFEVQIYDYLGDHGSETHNGRAGDVVFLLEGKDYRTRTRVEQYDYQYGDGDFIVNQTHSKGKGVNIVFVGDCFDAKDIATGAYTQGINEAIGHFFAVEPYKSYRDYFNVYTVIGLSPDSGMGTVNTIREAKFGSQYTLNEGITPNEEICFEYACKTPTVNEENIHQTLVVMIENSWEYGGLTYMWDDGSAIAICPMSKDEYPYDFRGLVQHEAGGHGFGKLGDEYIYHNRFITACPLCGDASIPVRHAHSLGWYQNLSLTGNMYEVPWSHLIFDEKYQNKVDIYEGGYMHTRGCFRSEPNSCMNNNIPYFSAISREAIVKRVMDYAGETFDFEVWKAADKGYSTDNTETRSVPFYEIPCYSSRKQHTPKFMGKKPQIGFNK